MSMTIDNLRVDHRVTVLRDFSDATGKIMRAGETGILRGLEWDQPRMEIHIVIERTAGKEDFVFPLKATSGPRNGHMKEFFEINEDVTPPRVIPAFYNQSKRQMIVPPLEKKLGLMNTAVWARVAQSTDGPDELTDIEQEMLRTINHIGVAGSIAELYAQRMRAFQHAGNERRAIAAFKLAVDWMGTYAGWATSGGEGEALSYERDQFRAALAREFGYDPTESKS